jgi:hypothetical protein
MPHVFFELVPQLLEGPIYLDISRDEIERILLQDRSFDRTFEDTETAVPVRICIQQRSVHLESISLALLVHEVRIGGIDFEVKFEDVDGARRHGWHKHIWDAIEQDADAYKVAVNCFDGADDLREWLIRAFKELKIQHSGKDYGEPTLQFD